MQKLSNYINHYVIIIDESFSMYRLRDKVIKVVDGLTAHLARTSQDLNQETRISVYAFNSRGTERCLVWDIDVLRMPSIDGMYVPDGRTALVDCTLLAISDIKTIPQKYGDHSVVVYVITDGQENDSRNRFALKQTVSGLPDNWTFGVFVPDQRGVTDAMTYGGFPRDNIQIWDASDSGLENVGKVMQTTSTTLMRQRTQGVRGTTSLFKLNTVSGSDITANLTPVPVAKYSLAPVSYDIRIDDFVAGYFHRPYQIGEGYYQLTKTETIQPQKSIAILYMGQLYTGAAARQMLGLPNETVRVKPDAHPDYVIYVQSTSLNRKLLAGTHLLVMK